MKEKGNWKAVTILAEEMKSERTGEEYVGRERLCGRLEVPPHGILEAWAALQVAVESIRDVEDALDVLHAQRLLVIHCERLRRADCVFDLLIVSRGF